MKILLLPVFFLFISCRDCRDIQVPYYEEEPYEAIETERIELTYLVGENESHRESGLSLFGIKPKIITKKEITNTGNKGGVFEVKVKYLTTLNDTIILRDSKFIGAGQTILFEMEQELQDLVTVKPLGLVVFPPTVEIQKRVTKFRRITKFRLCNTCEENCE